MIEEAIQFLLRKGAEDAKVLDIGDEKFSKTQLHKIEPRKLDCPAMATLDAFTMFVEKNATPEKCFISIKNPNLVVLYEKDEHQHRRYHPVAKATTDLYTFEFAFRHPDE